jgi:hypothetical protein
VLATAVVDDAAAWLGVPIAFVATGLGVGLLIERILRLRLSEPALLPLGTCASICALLAVYQLGGRGGFAAIVLVLAAFTGFLLARGELRTRLAPGPATSAAALVAAVYFAPAVLSGHWTWFGYNFLNDTAVQFLLADELKHHGVNLLPGAFSTRSEVIRIYLDSGYPLGSHAHVATLATLLGSGVDVVYQSYLGMLAVTSSVALTGIARLSGLKPRRAALAGAGALAASLIYNYALQGSIKEMAAFACVSSATLIGLELLRSQRPVQAAIALGITAAAMISVFSTAAGPYLVVLAAGLLLVAVLEPGTAARARLSAVLAVGALTTVVAALPTALSALTFLRVSQSALTTGGPTSELGQLQRPLDVLQVAGVYLSENYGLPIVGSLESSATEVLNWVVVVLAIIGAVLFIGRRIPGPVLLALSTLSTAAIVAPRASDYADAKLLALATPAVVFLALCGVLSLNGRFRIPGLVAASITLLGLIASSAYAYHGVRLAPVERFSALESAMAQVSGHRKVLLDEVEEFGKYYGRDAPHLNAAFEAITPSQAVPFGGGYHLDLDQLKQSFVQTFDAIVTRNGPSASRPPANFRRVYGNRYYQSWEKQPGLKVKAHLPVQSTLEAGNFVACDDIRAFARHAGPGDRLLAATVPDSAEVPIVDAPARPNGWPPLAAPPGVVEPRTPGTVERSLALRAGTYDIWVRTSTGRRLYVSVDGRRVGSVKGLNSQGQWLRVTGVRLAKGQHLVSIQRPGGGLSPGDGATSVLGPVAVVRRERRTLHAIKPKRAEDLCGKRWDWIELVSG